MALKYVASNTTYDFGKSEYTTTSNKYKRLNYIANGKTYQIGLATDSTATQYSPLKMKINDSTYYIGRSSSRSSSSSYRSTYSSRYVARVNTYTDRYTVSSIKTYYDCRGFFYYTATFYVGSDGEDNRQTSSTYHVINHTADEPQQNDTWMVITSVGNENLWWCITYETQFCARIYTSNYKRTETVTYTKSKIGTSSEYSTTTASSSTSNVTTVSSNNFV